MSSPTPAENAATMVARRHVEHDLLLSALPHPVLALSEESRIVYANPAAEAFFSASLAVLRRMTLPEIVGFACPLVALVDQVRRTGGGVNEYGIDVAMPRVDGARLAQDAK